MIEVKRYSSTDFDLWNNFNRNSKNRLFMFDRNYMDYHNDRFSDHSLLFYSNCELLALFPACEKDSVLHSHGGLTYGGFIINTKMKQHTMNDCFSALISYGRSKGFNRIIYKVIPYIYHLQPSEEDKFSLFANGAKLLKIDASTYLNLLYPLKMTKGRKAQISRAKREGVFVRELTNQKDFDTFINIENELLQSRHNTHAVHSSNELKMLHDRFPENIHLYAALKDNKMIAGAVVYEYENVIHTQYMAANEEARIIGGLDLVVSTIIDTFHNKKRWLDFGISTEHGKIFLNEGLIAQKESFGGRTGVYETWELNL